MNTLENGHKEVEALRSEVCVFKEKIDRQDNINVGSELSIFEITSRPNENLFNVFNSICTDIQINTPSVQNIFRLKNRDANINHNDGPIMVKVTSPYKTNYVMRSKATFRH